VWGEGVSGSAEAGPNLVLLPWVEALISTLPSPTLGPLGWVCGVGMSPAVGEPCCVWLFVLFCACLPTFPSVFNVLVPSACGCPETRRKSPSDSPAAANSFARPVRLPGERPSPWSSPVHLRRLLVSKEGKCGNQKV